LCLVLKSEPLKVFSFLSEKNISFPLQSILLPYLNHPSSERMLKQIFSAFTKNSFSSLRHIILSSTFGTINPHEYDLPF
jgi:hypothetical protein